MPAPSSTTNAKPHDEKPSHAKRRDDKKIDEAIADTFPASDPTSFSPATANEEPARPIDRQAPVIHKADIAAAQRSVGHKT